ncbi:MAG: chloride channel protein [Microthrixaceae bacterium]
MIATTASVAGGGVGGLFIPLVVAGAWLLGRAVGMVNSPQESLYVVVGIAAFLSAAGYRVPLAAIMFVAETTGRPSFVVPGVIAAVAAGNSPPGRSARSPPTSGLPTTSARRHRTAETVLPLDSAAL